MGTFGKIVVLGGGLITLLYLHVASVVKSLVFDFKGVTLEIIASDFTRLGVFIEVSNPKADNVFVEQTNINLFINGRFAGKLQNPEEQPVKGKSVGLLFFTVDILYSAVGDELWEMLKSGSGYSFDITISGNISMSGIPVAIPTIEVYSVTFDEILQQWKPMEK